jgi:S-formylglutathione hydrolase FrmB
VSLDVAHDYHESPGTHTWSHWDRQVREAIDFHRRNLNIPDDPEHEPLR